MSGENNEIRLNNDAGKTGEGNTPYAEYQKEREFSDAAETQRVFEFPQNRSEAVRKTSRKNAVWQRILVAAVAVVAVVVYDLVGLTPPSGARIGHNSIGAEETGIYFMIEFENYTSGDDLSVEIYNDFMRYRQEVEESFVSGEVYDLKPDMTYTLEVRSGNSVLLRKKVITRTDELYEESFDEPYETETAEPGQT